MCPHVFEKPHELIIKLQIINVNNLIRRLPQQNILTITIILQLLFYKHCQSGHATQTKRNNFHNRFEKQLIH